MTRCRPTGRSNRARPCVHRPMRPEDGQQHPADGQDDQQHDHHDGQRDRQSKMSGGATWQRRPGSGEGSGQRAAASFTIADGPAYRQQRAGDRRQLGRCAGRTGPAIGDRVPAPLAQTKPPIRLRTGRRRTITHLLHSRYQARPSRIQGKAYNFTNTFQGEIQAAACFDRLP